MKPKEFENKATERFPEIKEIKHDLNSLKHNVIGLTKHVQENGSDMTAELKDKVEKRLLKLRDKSKKQLHRLENKVKENPSKGLAAAFVAGIVASWLFGGRK